MSRYPGADSVPLAVHDRGLLTLWLALSLSTIGLYSWHAIAHALPIAPTLAMIGIAQLFCCPLGIAGFLLRRRRLKRIAEREAFLAHLDRAAE